MSGEFYQATLFVEESTVVTLYAQHEGSGVVSFFPDEEATMSVLAIFVKPTTLAKLRDVLNGPEATAFIGDIAAAESGE